MSIESLHTAQTGITGQNKATGNGALGTDPSLQGLNFLDVILAHLAQKDTEKTISNDAGEELLESENNALLDKNPKLDLAKLIAENPEIAEEIENYTLNQQTALSETLALNQEAFDEILKSIEDGTIVIEGLGSETENRTAIPKILDTLLLNGEVQTEPNDEQSGNLAKARKILAAIERLLSHEEANPGFIATNLTPERIASLRNYHTRIQNFIENNANPSDIDDQPIAGIAIGLVQIVPVKNDATNTANKFNNLASKLNALINKSPAGEHTQLTTGEQHTQNLPEEDSKNRFERVLKDFSDQKDAKASGKQPDNSPQTKPNLSTLPPLPASLMGSLNATGEWLNELSLTATPAQITDTANFTQLITQASHASRAHPAMQMVAAHIQKSAGGEGNKNIVLQLDPPELGKVEVNMDFGKDKSVKISIISEKPETFLMLQRDAQSLERVLANAGLDVEGSMDFELASQDHDFNQNGGHDERGSNGSGQSGENGEDSEAIESTMTWHVDSETGHMRYNLIV